MTKILAFIFPFLLPLFANSNASEAILHDQLFALQMTYLSCISSMRVLFQKQNKKMSKYLAMAVWVTSFF